MMQFIRVLILSLCLSATAHAIKVDTHAHLSNLSSSNISELISAMDNKSVDYTFLMGTPEPLLNSSSGDNTIAAIISFVSTYSGYENRFKFLYGGSELNYYLHGAGRVDKISSSNRWTDDDDADYSVYPNGCPGSSCSSQIATGLTEAQAIEADRTNTGTGSKYEAFIAAANAAAISGTYVGFGEIGALHYSRRSGHPYVHFPIDHNWMKELSDVAASYCMTIDLHAELESTNSSELANLLAHNSNTNIILEHVGWSSTGEDQLPLLESLMSTYDNLYLALKKCSYSGDGVDTCYVDYTTSTPSVKSDWLTFIQTYSDHIMIGSDAKYWATSGETAGQTMNWELRDKSSVNDQQGSIKILLDTLGLTSSYALNIMGDTADNLYGLSESITCSRMKQMKRKRMCSSNQN